MLKTDATVGLLVLETSGDRRSLTECRSDLSKLSAGFSVCVLGNCSGYKPVFFFFAEWLIV